MAPISSFQLTGPPGPQYCFLDSSVYHTNAPSIRIQPSTDANYREACGKWYSVKPGDHIVARCWIKVNALAGFVYNPNNAATRRGARILIDFYGHGHWLDSYPNTAAQDIAIIVPWGTQGWVLKTWDFIVPSKTYTIPVQYDPHPTSPAYRGPSQIDCIVMVLNCGNHGGGLDKANAWFSDAELYINPDFTSTAPRPLPQNVQIAVSSVTASSYSAGHPPGLAVDGIESPYNYWGTNALVPEGRVPQWLRLDLGSVHRLNTVTTHFYDGDVRTYTYYIQVSNDSSSWTTIVSTKTGSGSVTDTFSQVGARFVRITVTANTANPAAHIEEIKVFGFS